MLADRLHCAPWELRERPGFWRERAGAALNAEATARRELDQRAKRRQARKGRMRRR